MTRIFHDVAREKDSEDGATAGLAVDFDPSVMILDDPVADREAEPGATPRRLGGEERLEDLAQIRTGNPHAGVLDLDHHLIRPPAAPAVRRVKVPPSSMRVDRVEHERHEHLDQLLRVAHGARLGGIQLADHIEMLEPLVVLEQEQGVVDELVESDRRLSTFPWGG